MDIKIFTLLLIGVLGSFTEARSVFDYPLRNDRVRNINPSADFATWSRLKRAVGDSNGETTTTSQATSTTTPSSTPDTTTDPTTTEPTTANDEPSTTTSPTDTTTTPASTTTEATSSPSTTPTSTTATTPSSTSATTPATTTPAESSTKPDVLSRSDFNKPEGSEKPAPASNDQAPGPNYNPFFPNTFGPSFDPYYGYPGYNSIPGSGPNYAWTGMNGGPGYASSGASAGSFAGGYPTIGYPSMGSPAVDNRGGFQDTNAYPGYGTGYSSGGIDPYNTGFYFPGQYTGYDPTFDMIRQIQAQIEAQQRANMDFHNRLASEAAKYDGAQLASASIGIGPNGGFQTGQISPAAPGVESRFAEELPAPSGNSYGVFSSSRSSSMTGPDGKQINHKSSTTGINDNGKITFRTVHD